MRWRATRCRKTAGFLAVSTACGLATAPVLWLQFHAVPLLAVPANALAGPAVAPLLGLALAAAAVDPLAPGAAAALVWADGWLAAYLAFCASIVGGLPFAQLRSGWAAAALWPVRPLPPPMLGDGDRAELKPVYLLGGRSPQGGAGGASACARTSTTRQSSALAAEADGDEVVAACNALGLFGGEGRLVLVEGVEHWKAADAKAVAGYLRSPAPDTVLALVAEGLKKDSPLAKACAKAGDVLVYEASKRKLPRLGR